LAQAEAVDDMENELGEPAGGGGGGGSGFSFGGSPGA